MSSRLLRKLRAEPLNNGHPTPAAVTNDAGWLRDVPDGAVRWARHAIGTVRRHTGTARMPVSLPINPHSRVLVIVPPFASLWYPSLAAHVLQACVRAVGCNVDVLYANLLLAWFIGEKAYEQVGAESVTLAAERFFARSAFDLPALGHGAEQMFDPRRVYGEQRGDLYRGLYPDGRAASLGMVKPISVDKLARVERRAPVWVDQVATAIASCGYRIVGATTTFQQTTASIALLKRIKQLNPGIVTVLGGANCEGEMAEGLLALRTGIDYIFSGESEETFPAFVCETLAGTPPAAPIVNGRPCGDLDGLPPISSREFFEQRLACLPASKPSGSYLSYETSLGCWWGQKQHCTFCGLNGEGMAFRRKTPNRVLEELRGLLAESPTKNISMTDNIMPREYLRTLLPRLSQELPGLNIFYEQKSNLTFDDVLALKGAGVNTIQPGIEALSSRLLKLMRKGVLARQNLMLLRYGRIAELNLTWNMLCGFPNDELAAYDETMALVPLIMHLQPPSGLWHLSIDRFSPYFFEPQTHNVTNIRPLPVYHDFMPETPDMSRLAYHFMGDYPCDTHRHIEVVRELNAKVGAWARAWDQPYRRRPELKIRSFPDRFVLVDTRGLSGTEPLRELDASEAELLMNARPYGNSHRERQAVDRKIAVVVDDWFVPLPVVSQELFLDLNAERQRKAA